MKKCLFMFALLLLVAVLSSKQKPGTDVADLQPAQTLRIAQFNHYITVESDTGAWGMGGDLEAALRHMEEITAETVFLETAEYLIIAPELLYLLPELDAYLRPSCLVCVEEGQPDMAQVAGFLNTHEPAVTLQDYLAGMTDLPTLLTTQEGMRLVQ